MRHSARFLLRIVPGIFCLGLLPFTLAAARPSRVPSSARYLNDAKVWVLESGGQQTVWYENGQVKARGGWAGEQRNGDWQFWWDNGNLKGEGPYRANRKQGAWKYYHLTGRLKSTGNYENNLREGTWTYFHANGRKASEGLYRNNEKEGAWINYYESGQVFYKGTYHQDMAHGTWEYFFEGGKVHQKGEFRRDRRVGSWYICVFAEGPCGHESFNNPAAPAFSGMPPADSLSGNGISGAGKDTSDPMKLLDSLDSGPVPDRVPPGLKKNDWD